MRTVQHSLLALAVAALGVTVAACNNDKNMAPASPILSQAQADSLATTVVGDVVDEISTATMDGSGGGGLAGTASIDAAAPLGSAAVPQCLPAKSPTPVVDSDNDGVPDSVRFDYAGCVISLPLTIDSLSGTIDLIDPTPATADHSV